MKFRIIAIGKCKDKHLLNLIEDYAKRLQNKLEIIEVNASTKEKEADSILAKLNGYHPVLLDERGKRFASLEFANFIKKSGESFGPKIAFCIGGADGHSDILKRKIRDHVSLSDLTLPHMIVRLILAEQLYRAESIIKGHPYHREG